jgi:long-subunit fatty acid transport protein
MTSKPVSALIAVAILAVAAPAHAQFGDQRVGTSSGTFLRIGLGARAVGLGESFVAVANDPSAIYWNPAGLASLQRSELMLTHVEWPADIRYEHLVYVMPVHKLGGSLGVQFGVLSTEIQETTELRPFGTGRSFFYSDVVAGLAYARRWTDKLLVGGGVKYVHEDLGTEVGGPRTQAYLIDIGSIYYLGYGSVRIATALSNFGSEMRPSDPNTANGQWMSPITGETRTYDGFDPPLMFRYGLAFEPIENANQRLTASIEANQPADDAQVLKIGFEWAWQRRLALRSGYNFSADELKLSAGAGLYADIGQTQLTFDYAYTNGGNLESIHRMSLGVRF